MPEGSYYKDVREHLKALEERGKLVRVKQRINKDTELMPLVRWQFRGLDESQRKAFFFQNVIDVKGRHYSMPVEAVLFCRTPGAMAVLPARTASLSWRAVL